MNKVQTEFQRSLQKLIREDQSDIEKIYKFMYTKNITKISSFFQDNRRADQLFQEVFVIWLHKIQKARQQLSRLSSLQLETTLSDFFDKVVHNQLLSVKISLRYVFRHLYTQDELARSRLSQEVISSQNLLYAKQLIKELKIRTLEAQDLLQEAVVILLQAITDKKFVLAGKDNEIQLKQIHKYFRQIIYRQVHKLYRNNKKIQEVSIPNSQEHNLATDSYEPMEDDLLSTVVYRCFHSLDEISQKMLKYLYVDKIPANQIVKRLNHPRFTSTKNVIDHKMHCLNTLKQRTAEVIESLRPKSFKKYLSIISKILSALTEPCKTILRYALPPHQMTYREIVEHIQYTKVYQSEMLKTTDQVKKRKYKCMQYLQEEIWKTLLTINH